jgi:hypothetical protein
LTVAGVGTLTLAGVTVWLFSVLFVVAGVAAGVV